MAPNSLLTAERNPTETSSFVFVTGHEFGRRALEGLLSSDEAVRGRLRCALGVQLTPERRAATVGFATVDDLAEGWQFPLLTVSDGSLQTIADDIRRVTPHYLLVVGWSRIVAPDVLDIAREVWGERNAPRNTARYGNIGMHPSPLPLGRGQAPIPWTLINALRRTALSTFFLEDVVDSGSIVEQQWLRVRSKETASSLFLRFADLHFHAGRRLATMLAHRDVHAREQANRDAVVWPRRRVEDSKIDWTQSPDTVERLVRAQQWPYPLPFIPTLGGPIRIVKCVVQEQIASSPGQVLALDADGILLGVAGGVVRLVVAASNCDLARRQLRAGDSLSM
jgi:methionyl-tRNA formyltransferase